jgi:hypothetical protein
METNSHPEAVASTVKQGQYSPRKRKDTAPKVNPQLAIELFFQEMGRIEAYTKRIEDATSRKVQIDGKSLESAENRLKNVLSDFERQGYRMKKRRLCGQTDFVLLNPLCCYLPIVRLFHVLSLDGCSQRPGQLQAVL